MDFTGNLLHPAKIVATEAPTEPVVQCRHRSMIIPTIGQVIH